METRTLTSNPIYIHPAKSPDNMKTERNMTKIQSLIPCVSQNVAISERGDIIRKKPLLPTPPTNKHNCYHLNNQFQPHNRRRMNRNIQSHQQYQQQPYEVRNQPHSLSNS